MRYWIPSNVKIPTNGKMKPPEKKMIILALIGALAIIGLSRRGQIRNAANDADYFLDNYRI